jgi:diguanylate cyclase (GGDEF)-like protein/PAS domain S-box-containing protein
MSILKYVNLAATPIDSHKTKRILIVDDEPRLRAGYAQLLAQDGRSIEECATGLAAQARLNKRDIDVVVLDLNLPDISGIEIMHWMQINHLDTSVVVFSADESIDSAILALRQGAFEFIRKTCDPDDLMSAVARALRRRQVEQEHVTMSAHMEQSERLHRFLVEQSPDIIYTLDNAGHFVFINRRAETLLGYEPNELIGKHYSVIVHPDDMSHANYTFNERRIGDRASSNVEIRLKSKNLSKGFLHFDNRVIVTILSSQGVYAAKDDSPLGNFVGTAGVARDITERKKAEETITFQAFHDLLTGLPNRVLFNDRLDLAVIQAERRQQRLGVMFIDLDRFKLVNDTYGHPEGDELLKAFSRRTRSCLRSGDTLGRLGGDEFTVLLPDINSESDVITIAEKIMAEMTRPFTVGGQDYYASASIGIAIYPEDGNSSESLVRNADIAMYQTKNQGKNGYLHFTPAMSSNQRDRIVLENDLRAAIKTADQFELHYQPQISDRKRSVIGFEALIRWQHPTRGLIGPDEFIPLAEETGLIIGISDWVLNAACKQLQAWRKNGHDHFKMAINLSPKEFEQGNLVDRVKRHIATYELPPESIEIEITESLLMNDAEKVIEKVSQLRQLGIQVSIDDFGTRYSSLNYLRRFPVSSIKIDQSFVRDLLPNHSPAIIDAIIGIGHSFSLDVLAEGVETELQCRALRKLGCDKMQGFYFSRPLPAARIQAMLASGEFPLQ